MGERKAHRSQSVATVQTSSERGSQPQSIRSWEGCGQKERSPPARHSEKLRWREEDVHSLGSRRRGPLGQPRTRTAGTADLGREGHIQLHLNARKCALLPEQERTESFVAEALAPFLHPRRQPGASQRVLKAICPRGELLTQTKRLMRDILPTNITVDVRGSSPSHSRLHLARGPSLPHIRGVQRGERRKYIRSPKIFSSRSPVV